MSNTMARPATMTMTGLRLRGLRWWTLPAAYVFALVQGNLWYSTLLFGSAATAVNGPETVPGPLAFATLLLILQPVQILAAAFIASFLPLQGSTRLRSAGRGLAFGALIGAGLLAPPFAAAMIFYGKPLAAFLIPAGEQVARLTGFGLILALGRREA